MIVGMENSEAESKALNGQIEVLAEPISAESPQLE